MMRKRSILPDEITRLIGIVEAARSSIPKVMVGVPDSWDEHRRKGRQALEDLASRGARVRVSGDITSLTFGGIRSTSTGGAPGVLGNWLVAARKRLEKCL